MSLEFYEAAAVSPSGASDGVFIPIADLPGVVAGELAAAEDTGKKVAKAILGALQGIANTLPSNALGLTVTRATASPGTDLTNNILTLTSQFYVDHETKQMDSLPVPSAGANSGVGGVAITDVFPNAEKIAADGAISGEGFLIPTANIAMYGAPAHGAIALANDSRLWFMGLAQWLTVDSNFAIRSPSQASGIVARSRGGTAAVTLPANATAATDPTTDLAASDLSKISVLQHSFSVTVQTIMDQAAQTFDVNVVSS